MFRTVQPSSFFLLPNGEGKTIKSGWCSHISSSSYTKAASRLFFHFGGG
jgi:hypothetical protein